MGGVTDDLAVAGGARRVGVVAVAQWPVNALGVTMGGHVRTGLEDNLYMDAGKHDPATNVRLVARVAALAAAVGRPLATPADVRRLIGLPARMVAPL